MMIIPTMKMKPKMNQRICFRYSPLFTLSMGSKPAL